jgi:hypothetical protein
LLVPTKSNGIYGGFRVMVRISVRVRIRLRVRENRILNGTELCVPTRLFKTVCVCMPATDLWPAASRLGSAVYLHNGVLTGVWVLSGDQHRLETPHKPWMEKGKINSHTSAEQLRVF